MKFPFFSIARRLGQRVAMWRQRWLPGAQAVPDFTASCRRARKAQRRAAFTQHTMAHHPARR
jgi:hypothetical protein